MPATTRRMASSMEDDIDAITPCAPMDLQQQKDEHHDDDEHMHSRRSSHDGGFFLSSPAAPDCCPSTTACACSVADMRTTRSSSPTSEYEAAAAAAMYPNAQRQRRNESVRALEEGTDGDPARLWRRMLALQQHYGCYRSARMSAALESGDSSMLLPSKACLDMMNADMVALPEEAEHVIEGWRARLRNKVRGVAGGKPHAGARTAAI